MTKVKKEAATAESTALVLYTPEEQAYLDSLKSEAAQTDYNGPAKLMINTAAKDSDGVRRPIGGWHIQGTDKYFDGVIRLRPIRTMYKLIRYNVDAANNYKIAGQSVYFKDFTDGIIDSLGGTNLGRKFGRAYSAEEKEATRKLAECYLDIFGFVKLGDDENHPVVYRVRGSKIMTIMNAFRAVPKDKKFSEFEYEIETFQPEGKQYWDIKINPDMSERLPIAPILAYDAEINDYITESNLAVISSHRKNQASEAGDKLTTINAKVVSATLSDDDLPF